MKISNPKTHFCACGEPLPSTFPSDALVGLYLCVRLHFIATLGQIVACCRYGNANDPPHPRGLLEQMESGSEN